METELTTCIPDINDKYVALIKENKLLKTLIENAESKLDVLDQTWTKDDTISAYFEVITLRILVIKGISSL